MTYFFIIFTVACLAYALFKKRFAFLLAPVAALFLYIGIQIVLVPAPLAETLKFILSLR